MKFIARVSTAMLNSVELRLSGGLLRRLMDVGRAVLVREERLHVGRRRQSRRPGGGKVERGGARATPCALRPILPTMPASVTRLMLGRDVSYVLVLTRYAEAVGGPGRRGAAVVHKAHGDLGPHTERENRGKRDVGAVGDACFWSAHDMARTHCTADIILPRISSIRWGA